MDKPAQPGPQADVPDQTGHFGAYCGRFAPEALMAALDELTGAYFSTKEDPDFQTEFDHLLRTYTGRPTALTEVPRFAAHAGGCRVLLKREDQHGVAAGAQRGAHADARRHLSGIRRAISER